MKMKKIYHISTPFETEDTGDYDYGTAIVNALNNLDSGSAEYITLKSLNLDNQDYKKLFNKFEAGDFKNLIDDINSWEKELKDIFNNQQKTIDSVYNSWKTSYDNWSNNSLRETFITKVIQHITTDSIKCDREPIISIQLRLPDTGIAFVQKDLLEFHKAQIKVNITCHEYKLNQYTRVELQAISHLYFKEADTVSFFNIQDLSSASKHARYDVFDKQNMKSILDKGFWDNNPLKYNAWSNSFIKVIHTPYSLTDKVLLTRVPPTVVDDQLETKFEEWQARSSNIIVFGLIRNAKGYEEALDFAKAIKNSNISAWPNGLPRVIIAGKPFGKDLLWEIITEKYEVDLNSFAQDHNISKREAKKLYEKMKLEYTNNYSAKLNQLEQFTRGLFNKHFKSSKHQNEVLPIDIILNPTPQDVKELLKKTKYSVKFDNKGWADNASSHINALSSYCIVYTGWGMNTSNEVSIGEHKGAISFLNKGKYGLRLNSGEVKTTQKLSIEDKIVLTHQKSFYKLSSATFTPPNTDPVTAKDVVSALQANEQNSNLCEESFNKATQLKAQFNAEALADIFVQDYSNIFLKNFSSTTERDRCLKKKLNEIKIEEIKKKISIASVKVMAKQDEFFQTAVAQIKNNQIEGYKKNKLSNIKENLLTALKGVLKDQSLIDLPTRYDYDFILEEIIKTYNIEDYLNNEISGHVKVLEEIS